MVNVFLPKFCLREVENIIDRKETIKNNCMCSHSKRCEICKVTKKFFNDVSLKIVNLHEMVKQSGKPNYKGCRVIVNNKINTEFWNRMLIGYNDTLVIELLQYGFPLDFQGDVHCFPKIELWKNKNHKGAESFPVQITNYLEKKKSNFSIIGPFKSNPFTDPLIISPLNTVPKKDTEERRVILDLSFPRGCSINDFISKDRYLGEEIDLFFPRVDDFIKLIKAKGRHCLMFKLDLRKAYRQISICPRDYNLVSFRWKKHIFCDTVLSMGLRNAAAICQRVTNAIAFMMFKIGIAILNYLDDLAGVETKDKAWFAFYCLRQVLEKAGLIESKDKACIPSESMHFLGVLFNSDTMTMEVTSDRLIEIRLLIVYWLNKQKATLRELQSLIGKLNFVAACVRPGRIFINRLLNWLRSIYDIHPNMEIEIPDYVKMDLQWWDKFLLQYNGISIMLYDDWSKPDGIFSTDSCLTGCGGYFNGLYFHTEFPEDLKQKKLDIGLLELITVIVALKIWGRQFRGKRIVVYCDNQSVCQILNSGKSRSEEFQNGLREVCYLTAIHECELKTCHLSSNENRLADSLSRWHLGEKFQEDFKLVTSQFDINECFVSKELFQFVNNW